MTPADVIKLVPGDLDDLDKVQEQRSSIKRLRDHHHLIARLVAEGRRSTDIAREVGLSVSRVSILKGDPAFQQLVEMYRANVNQIRDASFAEVEAKGAFLANEILDIMIDRALDEPDTLSNDILDKWLSQIADRIGFIKTHRNLNLNAQANLENLAERVAARRRRPEQLSAPSGAGGPGPDRQPIDLVPVPQEDKK